MSFIFRSKKQSEFKKWQVVLLLIIVGSAVIFKIFFSGPRLVTINLAGTELKVLVADTPALRYQGWSDYKNMGKADGMLFIFSEVGQHAMVMRAMQFPLDIVWLNGKAVVDIAPGVEPEASKSEAELTPYFGRAPSTAVLELSAGFAKKNSLKVGDSWEIVKSVK
ncbi:MAG: DUF192 domain-containing protein [Candidatus Magasanikbacteria bacterium]|nr:DUF192 domain-containing protein [Candidatus Magasanikbacteria bacterium]